jgi:hypothetical protein
MPADATGAPRLHRFGTVPDRLEQADFDFEEALRTVAMHIPFGMLVLDSQRFDRFGGSSANRGNDDCDKGAKS